MNTNEHELDGSIRVNWCPSAVRKSSPKCAKISVRNTKDTENGDTRAVVQSGRNFFVIFEIFFVVVPCQFCGLLCRSCGQYPVPARLNNRTAAGRKVARHSFRLSVSNHIQTGYSPKLSPVSRHQRHSGSDRRAAYPEIVRPN